MEKELYCTCSDILRTDKLNTINIMFEDAEANTYHISLNFVRGPIDMGHTNRFVETLVEELIDTLSDTEYDRYVSEATQNGTITGEYTFSDGGPVVVCVKDRDGNEHEDLFDAKTGKRTPLYKYDVRAKDKTMA